MDYMKMEKLGEGTYGTVYKAKHISSDDIVAMKKVRFDTSDEGISQTYLREISMLKELDHPNIVKMIDVVWEGTSFYIVFEFLFMDLRQYLDKYELMGLDTELIKSYLYQISKALLFCHQRRILHRDLKPENLLIDKTGIIKIADFGLGRAFSVPLRVYSQHVMTLWYRAPEILLGMKSYGYGCPIDIWSLGCIFAEMKTGIPLFDGDSEIEQIQKIFRVCKMPTEEDWPDFAKMKKFEDVDVYYDFDLRDYADMDDSEFKLFEQMLVYNPAKRISAKKIIQHSYFDGFDQKLIPISFNVIR